MSERERAGGEAGGVHSCRGNLSHKWQVGDIALQRSGCVEEQELYNNEDRRERGITSQTVKIYIYIFQRQRGEWTDPKVTGHFHCTGEEAAQPRISCHLVDVQSVDSEEGGRQGGRGGGGAGDQSSSQSSSPLLN